jgi:hypothetical protein
MVTLAIWEHVSNLQAFYELRRLDEEHEVAQCRFEGKGDPEHAIEPTHGIFGATESVFAETRLGV